MGDLPHISEVDSAEKFYRVVHEANESLRNDKVLAYLNQTGLINYNEQKQLYNQQYPEQKYLYYQQYRYRYRYPRSLFPSCQLLLSALFH